MEKGIDISISSFDQYYYFIATMLNSNSLVYYGAANDSRPSITILVTRYLNRDSDIVFTYGLSSSKRREWAEVRPELVLYIDVSDRQWTLMLADAAWVLRCQQPAPLLPSIVDLEASLGHLAAFDYKHPHNERENSAMTAFLIAPPRLFDPGPQFDLPDRTIRLWQAYPIYPDEIPVIQRAGAAQFLDAVGAEIYAVRRAPVADLPADTTLSPIPIYTKAACTIVKQPRLRTVNRQKLIRSVTPLMALIAERDTTSLRQFFPGTDEEWSLLIEEFLEYPATFQIPPRSRWKELVDASEPLDIPNSLQWDVDITLWSAVDGPTDLTLQLRVIETKEDQYTLLLLGIHVL